MNRIIELKCTKNHVSRTQFAGRFYPGGNRFRVRGFSGSGKQYTFEQTRQGLWLSTLAGGVSNIWGNPTTTTGGVPSGQTKLRPYPNANELMPIIQPKIIQPKIRRQFRFLLFLGAISALYLFIPSTFAETEADRGRENKTSEPKQKVASSVLWKIDNFEQIGGLKPKVLGTPRRIHSKRGPALTFNGESDGLFIFTHPLQGAKQFTVEIVFRPAKDGKKEQRFFHMQENGSENRILLETRLLGDGRWFLDTFILADGKEFILFAEDFPHRLGPWYHVALVVDEKQMRHYVNGKLEMNAPIDYVPQGPGKTSIGMRINEVYWYRGDIREARFSRRVLSPAEFHMHPDAVGVP